MWDFKSIIRRTLGSFDVKAYDVILIHLNKLVLFPLTMSELFQSVIYNLVKI